MTSERESSFNVLACATQFVYHTLYFLFFIPGLMLAFLINFMSGGSIALMKNVRFIGGCEMYNILQLMMSMLGFGCIGLTAYIYS